jgi:carboxyl-terminal processing protease
MSVETAVSKIRGQAGTEVTLLILHQGAQDPADVIITRERIEVTSLNMEIKDVEGVKIAVVKLSRFAEDTKGAFDHAVDVMLQNGVKGIVLDLRSNPGGYLETAVTTAAYWVDAGNVVVQERLYTGEVTELKADSWPRLKGIKTVVLVNGGSASASEIVAGALQDYSLATLVGEKTYGKGSVQELTELKDDSTLKITVAEWLTPNGRSIDKNGLEPDQRVELTLEDFQNGRDPQLDKALELLK